MAAVISSVVPVPGSYTNAVVTINGTGFGVSTGSLYIAFPATGQVFNWSAAGWGDTLITTVYPDLGDFQDQGVTYPTDVFFVVIPAGDTVGGRSVAASVSLDPTPITFFPDNTLIVAGPTATAEGDFGPEPPPPTVPLRTALGRTNAFDNPGYDVKWYEYNPNSGVYVTGLDVFTQTDFSVVGTAVQQSLEFLGVSIPLI